MIYAADIKKHMQQMEKKTRLPSKALDFVTSNHVAHYRTHPTVYSKRIDEVLATVEDNWTVILQLIDKDSQAPLLPTKKRKRTKARKIKKSKPTL